MKTTIIMQLISGALGSVGFGLIFRIKNKYLPLVFIGGIISWLLFLIGKELWGGAFLPALLAGLIADIYAEILARVCKATSTSFFVTSVIPLIPGSSLYYCMNSMLEGNLPEAFVYGKETFLIACGLAAGMSIAWEICYFIRSIRK